MIVRALREEEKTLYNAVVQHPLQSWEWGEFRKKTGIAVERVGFFDAGKLVRAIQITFHPIPVLGRTLGYLPKGTMPDEEQLDVLKQLGKQHNALFVKLEPDVSQLIGAPNNQEKQIRFLLANGCVPGRPLFTKFTYQLDLTKTEAEILEGMHSKTRYNIRLAERKGVQIFENTTEAGMEQYLEILQETTSRQGFYAHSPEYFRLLWKTLGNTGMLRIFSAVYEDTIVASWVMFVFNNRLYYPYGASRSIHREVMASNLLMWEMIKLGKTLGCSSFDMWGSLGPEPNSKDPWFGFHKFKQGYGPALMEFIGTYDLILDPVMYKVFRLVEFFRWKYLRLRALLKL